MLPTELILGRTIEEITYQISTFTSYDNSALIAGISLLHVAFSWAFVTDFELLSIPGCILHT